MTQKQPYEVGVFETYEAAERAVAELTQAGFPAEAISVICPTCSTQQFAAVDKEDPAGTKTPAAAATGGVIGAVLGGLTAAVGIVASGGMGLLVAGPLLGATATGGVAGAFIGSMLTRGFESEITNFYDQALEKGQILVAADTRQGPGRKAAERALADAGALPFALPNG